MKKTHYIIAVTWLLSFLIIFNVSCEKPESNPQSSETTVEEQEPTTAERLVGTWVRDYSSIPVYDTIVFMEDGKCSYIIGNYYSDGTSYSQDFYFECSERFLLLYKSLSDYNPYPHYIKFYDDYTYFVMYNSPFEVIHMVMNVGFKKVE